MSHLRKRILRLAHAKPELRQYLIPLLKEAAQGHRLLKNVKRDNFASLAVSVAYDTPRGEKWDLVVKGMKTLALDDKDQWTDAVMLRFANKAAKSTGFYVTKVRVYGRVQDPMTRKPLMGLLPLIEWSREDGFYWVKGSQSELKQLELERERAEQKRQEEERAEKERLKRIDEEREALRLHNKWLRRSKPEGYQAWSVVRPIHSIGLVRKFFGPNMKHYNGSRDFMVDKFDSKEEAIAYARKIGGAMVVRGTQIWYEPLGQVEEHREEAWYKFYR